MWQPERNVSEWNKAAELRVLCTQGGAHVGHGDGSCLVHGGESGCEHHVADRTTCQLGHIRKPLDVDGVFC